MPGDELDEVEFLTRATLALGELGREEEILPFVAQSLARLTPDSLVAVTSYDPRTGMSTVRAIAGSEEMLRTARQIAPEPIGETYRVDLRARQVLSAGSLHRLEDGMHQLTFGTWSVEAGRRFESALGIRAIFGQPFSREGDFLGAVAFLSRSPSLEHARLIEAFVRLVAIVIHRRRAEVRLRESEQRFRMLAENSQDMIFRLHLVPTLSFEYVSPATTSIIGYTPDEIYADARLGAECLYPAAWRGAGELRELPSEPVVTRCRRRDGTYMWTEQKFTAIREDGRIVAIEGTARDITKRKEAEDALVDSNRRKTEFLAVLSHELRNPLGAISNGIHVLGRAPPGSEPAGRARGVIERQIAQLTRLIDDLLDVTRITRGRIRLRKERVELSELARSTVEDHRALFDECKICLETCCKQGDVFVDADRTRVRQILDNLLQNACRFTPPGGKTTVSVGTDAAGERAVLSVHNTGVVIPNEIRAHLFEPFVQADHSLDRGKGGLGLGLALVKGLVDLHHGSVKVESNEPLGTTFTIELALAEPAPRTSDHPVREEPRPVHARVLLMEDNADAAASLRDVLELDDLAVAVASNGREGIEKARTFHPDVVVCDIGLPEMDGYEVARAIRADPELEQLALVALTGYASPEDVARSREAGFDRHLAKPPDIDVLERVILELAQRPH